VSGLFLTADELRDLTGRARPGAQIKWLRANGFDVVVRADGLPRVLRAAVEARMGAPIRPTEPSPVKPDWSSLDATRKTA